MSFTPRQLETQVDWRAADVAGPEPGTPGRFRCPSGTPRPRWRGLALLVVGVGRGPCNRGWRRTQFVYRVGPGRVASTVSGPISPHRPSDYDDARRVELVEEVLEQLGGGLDFGIGVLCHRP